MAELKADTAVNILSGGEMQNMKFGRALFCCEKYICRRALKGER